MNMAVRNSLSKLCGLALPVNFMLFDRRALSRQVAPQKGVACLQVDDFWPNCRSSLSKSANPRAGSPEPAAARNWSIRSYCMSAIVASSSSAWSTLLCRLAANCVRRAYLLLERRRLTTDFRLIAGMGARSTSVRPGKVWLALFFGCGIRGAIVKNNCPDALMGQLFKKGRAMAAVIHSTSERIDVRASAPVKQLRQEAARVAHKNMSEFLLDAGIIAANQTLADRARFELSDEKWRAFQTALY